MDTISERLISTVSNIYFLYREEKKMKSKNKVSTTFKCSSQKSEYNNTVVMYNNITGKFVSKNHIQIVCYKKKLKIRFSR